MTVSRALSGNPNVSTVKRDAILAKAVELGYVKNSAANTMRGEPSAIVGLLLPNVINEFYARFANALGLHCADQGLDLVIHLTNDELERERKSLLRLQSLQASTVVMVPTPLSGAKQLEKVEGLRVISLIRTRNPETDTRQVLLDDGSSIEAAVEHLLGRGYRHIAYIGAAESLSSGQGRLAAYMHALRRNNIEPDPCIIQTGSPGYDMGGERIAALLEGDCQFDSLVCGGFEISNGALNTCLQRGLCFPGDLAFIGYGDPSAYQWIADGITTISLSAEDLAERTAAMLVCEDTSNLPDKRLSPTRLVIRNST